MASPSRRPVRRAPVEEEEIVPSRGSGAARRKAAAKQGLPMVPLAIGGGIVLLIVVVVLMMKRHAPAPEPTPIGSAAANGASVNAVATKQDAAPTAATGASAPPPAPVAAPFDRASYEAKVAAAATAVEALALGEQAERSSKEVALAELAYQKALALEPKNAAARRKLDVRAIDPQADFPRLDEIQGSAQTYLLRPFLKLKGKELSRSERAAEVARWTKERVAIDARIAEAADDPFLNRIDRLRNDLGNKPFFQDFNYEVIESTRPYALFVELKGDTLTERDARREAVEEAYAPFLAAYDQTIHTYLKPLSPAPPKEDPTFIVFILLNRESYDRFFLEFEDTAGPPGMRAHYTPVEKWAFTYSPQVSNPKDPSFIEGTQSLLHELTHAWVDRLATGDGGKTYSIRTVFTHWFNEGIAEWMSCQAWDDEKVLFRPWKSMRMQELAQRPAGVRIPLKRALRVVHSGDLGSEAAQVAREQKVVDPAQATMICMSGFYADMWLFIFWLNFGNDRKYKHLFEEYVRKEFAGNGGAETADRIFAEVFARQNLEQEVDAFQQGIAKGTIRFEDAPLELEK